jgi:NADPH:quinone reductase-like Zn-dependent oxidoreductase
MSTTPSTDGTDAAVTGTNRRMAAIVQTGYGDADVLKLSDVERPTISDDQVLVRVHAAGLDRGTWHLMTGTPYAVRLALGLRAPRQPIAGRDVAGVVTEVGAAVTRFAVGDEVFGITGGSFAEYAAVRESKLAHKPAAMTYAEAALLGISGTTALRALVDSGRLHAGQRVLVIGASGGVGSYAVQIAKALGAEVTGVCSTAKVDLVRSLGADHVVDYTSEDAVDGSTEYDLILDIGGSTRVSHLRRALAPRGTLVLVGGEGGGNITGMGRQLAAAALSPFVRQRLTLLTPKESHESLERLAGMVTAGSVRSIVDRTFPLSEAADAMRRLVSGQVRGKIAITVAPTG